MAEEKKQAKPIGPEDRGQEGGVESPVDLGDAPLVDLSDVGPAGRLSPAENPVTLLEDELAPLKDKLLRTLAAPENVRRPAPPDRADGRRAAADPVITYILRVAAHPPARNPATG